MEAFAGVLPIPALFVGVLFLYSSIGKLSSQAGFIQSLLLIPFLPHRLSRILGTWIPLTELLIGACLFWNLRWAKVAAIAALIAFSIVAVLAVSRNQRVPCNCFGTDSAEFLSKATVVRNVALVSAVIVTFDVPEGAPSLVAITYALVAFFTFLNVIKARKLSDLHRQSSNGSLP
jgi:hypothetical protein